mmetsp:Transcript_13949/g.35836  ORF Transcript_13949/g.35836 Transcript_13949/m.35836 type:complete len:278 (+) Transcript_13949:208-1041(+)
MLGGGELVFQVNRWQPHKALTCNTSVGCLPRHGYIRGKPPAMGTWDAVNRCKRPPPRQRKRRRWPSRLSPSHDCRPPLGAHPRPRPCPCPRPAACCLHRPWLSIGSVNTQASSPSMVARRLPLAPTCASNSSCRSHTLRCMCAWFCAVPWLTTTEVYCRTPHSRIARPTAPQSATISPSSSSPRRRTWRAGAKISTGRALASSQQLMVSLSVNSSVSREVGPPSSLPVRPIDRGQSISQDMQRAAAMGPSRSSARLPPYSTTTSQPPPCRVSFTLRW